MAAAGHPRQQFAVGEHRHHQEVVVGVHAAGVGVVEEEDVAVGQPHGRIVDVVLEHVLDRAVMQQSVQDHSGGHAGQISLGGEDAHTEVAGLQHLGHAQVLAHVAAVVDYRVELVQEDLEVDRVEAALASQFPLGGGLQHLAVQHFGVEPGPGLHEGATEAGDALVEAHGGHIQEPGPAVRCRHGHGRTLATDPPRRIIALSGDIRPKAR